MIISKQTKHALLLFFSISMMSACAINTNYRGPLVIEAGTPLASSGENTAH